MNYLEALEANLRAPLAKICPGIVERIAEFDEHVQRHEQTEDVFTARVVNQGFYGDKGAAGRKGIVGRADEVQLLLQIPVVENHTHGDHVRFRQRVLKEIAGGCAHAIAQPGRRDVLPRDRFYGRQIEGNAPQIRIRLSDFYAKQASRATDIAKRLELRKIKLRRERLEVNAREAGHRAHELFESRQLCVKLLEHSLQAVLDFVLRTPSAQGLRQVVPELEEPAVEHRQPTADIARTSAVEIERACGRVEVSGRGAVTRADEELHRHECVEEIADTA